MTDSIDWTDETLRSLDELARIAFSPGSGVTAENAQAAREARANWQSTDWGGKW
jgi:hypothetical protein